MFKVGQRATFSKTVTESDANTCAGLTGDFNQIHIKEEVAKDSVFGSQIAHEMLSVGFISGILGTKLPGEGIIYLGQTLQFLKPVYIGDTITAICEIIEVLNPIKRIYKLRIVCKNQNNEIVIDGEAVVKNTTDIKTNDDKSDDGNRNNSFYSQSELSRLGLKSYGLNVLISRNAVLYQPELLEIGNNVRIDDFTKISGKVVLGDYIHIAQFCGLYGGNEGIFMDDFSGLSSRVVIYATSNDYSGESLTNPAVPEKYRSTDKSYPVKFEKHVIVGTTSVILPGVTIGEGCSIGVMSTVFKTLEPWGIYVGSPVRRIKEHSKKLLELEQQLRAEEELEGAVCKFLTQKHEFFHQTEECAA